MSPIPASPRPQRRGPSKRTVSSLVTVLAALTLVPVAAVAPNLLATAAPSFGPTRLFGIAVFPDGTTPAPAAVVDVALAVPAGWIGARPFTRGVAGPDGSFQVPIPEVGELVQLAQAGGGTLAVRVSMSKLFDREQYATASGETWCQTLSTGPAPVVSAGPISTPSPDPDPALVNETLPYVRASTGPVPTVDPDSLTYGVLPADEGNLGDALDPAAPSSPVCGAAPGLIQYVYDTTLALVHEAEQRIANLIDNPKDLEFHVPQAQPGKLIGRVADLLHAQGIYNDPDLIAGKDNLDDPDVIPPLFAERFSYDVTDADSVCGMEDDAGLLATGNISVAPCPPLAEDQTSGCPLAEHWLVPARGATQMRGTASTATLYLMHCKNEVNDKADYWAWKWHDAHVTNVDTSEEYVFIWRYKQRTELVSNRKVNGQPAPYDFTKYLWLDTDPDRDQYGDGAWQIHWQVGFEDGPAANVSGDYTVIKAKKIHPWDDSKTNEHKVYHVSWISNTRNGSRGDWFYSGGGMAFTVPNGEPKRKVRTATHRFDIWRCWVPKDPPMAYSCDPQD